MTGKEKQEAALSTKVLHLHDNLPKWISSLMVQMRTGKIGLKKFLYERNVSDIDDTECACGEGEETVSHVLAECSQFGELRRTTWQMRSGELGKI